MVLACSVNPGLLVAVSAFAKGNLLFSHSLDHWMWFFIQTWFSLLPISFILAICLSHPSWGAKGALYGLSLIHI